LPDFSLQRLRFAALRYGMEERLRFAEGLRLRSAPLGHYEGAALRDGPPLRGGAPLG